MVLFWIFLLIFSIFLLIKSSDYFADSLEVIAVALGVPMFIIGVTLASIATSLPELATALLAAINPVESARQIIAGNVIGSNIANIALVVGLTAALVKLKIDWDIVKVDLPLFIGAALLLGFTIYDGWFSPMESVIFIIGYMIFLKYSFDIHKAHKQKNNIKTTKISKKAIIILILSLAGIFVGAKYCVDSVINLATAFGISEGLIAITAVALGTSLPELSVSLTAALKGKHELSLGNITGSNIFNIFMVMGIPGLMGGFAIAPQILAFGFPFMIGLFFLFTIMALDRELTRYEGLILLLLYGLFIIKVFGF